MTKVREEAGGAEILAWDVVNEAINDGGTDPLKTVKPWYPLLPSYIDDAFTFARAADKDALLFYNDYNIVYNNKKVDRIVDMVKSMQKRKVPIDGIGFQTHLSADGNPPTREHIAATIKRFGDLGL